MENKVNELKESIRDLVNRIDEYDDLVRCGDVNAKRVEETISIIETKIKTISQTLNISNLEAELLKWSKEVSKFYTSPDGQKVPETYYFDVWKKYVKSI